MSDVNELSDLNNNHKLELKKIKIDIVKMNKLMDNYLTYNSI